MAAANNIPAVRESLNLRIKPAERDLIDRAAKARGKIAPNLSLRPPEPQLKRRSLSREFSGSILMITSYF